MNIKVGEITFDEQRLEIILLEQLKENSICLGHLFLKMGEKYFLMLRAADFIDREFIEKYKKKGIEKFYYYPVANNNLIQKYQNFWNELKNSRLEKEKIQLIEMIFIELGKDYWIEGNEHSFIDFIIACYNEFYNLGNDIINLLQSTSHILYTRAIQVGAHVLIAAMANGYTDFNFLKDLYNVCFVLDYGLVSTNFNWNIINACEFERNNPHLGKKAIKNILPNPDDYELFINHPIKSFELLLQEKEKFNFPEILWAIKVHHEKNNGSGFPKGLTYNVISDWESIIQYADYVVAFEERTYQNGDYAFVFKNSFQNLYLSAHIKILPVSKIVQNVNKIFKWVQSKLKEEEVA